MLDHETSRLLIRMHPPEEILVLVPLRELFVMDLGCQMQQLLLSPQGPRTELIQVSIKFVKKFGDGLRLWVIWHVLYHTNFSSHAQIHLDVRVQLLQIPKKIFQTC